MHDELDHIFEENEEEHREVKDRNRNYQHKIDHLYKQTKIINKILIKMFTLMIDL
jgi:hypothetical protein